MARPKKLDDTKKREICALVTAGMRWRDVAAYVGCDEATIRRTRQSDVDFDQRVRRAEMGASLNPLEAMRRASALHWRAAAWMLERQERRDSAPQDAGPPVGVRELDTLAQQVAGVIRYELANPLTTRRILEQVDSLFFVARVAAGGTKTSPAAPGEGGSTLTQKMKLLEQSFAERREARSDEYAGIEHGSAAAWDHIMSGMREKGLEPPVG